MTFNLGIRYEITMPFVETGGQMANLDTNADFTAAGVVLPGQMGPYSGVVFPSSLVKPDWNNVGPRIGMARRVAKGTVLNTSYSITYNTSSYVVDFEEPRRPAPVFRHGDEPRHDRRPALSGHRADRRHRPPSRITSASIRTMAWG